MISSEKLVWRLWEKGCYDRNVVTMRNVHQLTAVTQRWCLRTKSLSIVPSAKLGEGEPYEHVAAMVLFIITVSLEETAG